MFGEAAGGWGQAAFGVGAARDSAGPPPARASRDIRAGGDAVTPAPKSCRRRVVPSHPGRGFERITTAAGGAASRRGVTARTAERKRSAEEKAAATRDDLAELEQEILDEIAEIDEKWQAVADEVDTLAIRLEATDVRVLETRVVWVPSD